MFGLIAGGAPRLRDLAREAKIDVDDLLILLWDNELTRFESPDDVVYDRELKAVLRLVGLPTAAELQSKSYWGDQFNDSPAELDERLRRLGFDPRPGKKTLPRGAIKRLRSELKAASARRKVAELPPPAAKTAHKPKAVDPPAWPTVGHVKTPMRYLTRDEVERIHLAIAKEFATGKDPIAPAGVQTDNLLESAIARPQVSNGNDLKYPTVEMAGAALFHSIGLNHAFYNGNKRTALVSALVFLDENGLVLSCDQDEFFKIVLRLAKHALTDVEGANRSDAEVLELARWFLSNTVHVDYMERPVQWRRLKSILSDYGCEFEFEGRDNCLTIRRSVDRPARFLVKAQRVQLRASARYMGDGTELDKGVVAKIRKDLELDESHGYPSSFFYDKDPLRVDEWIQHYRKTLSRLARL